MRPGIAMRNGEFSYDLPDYGLTGAMSEL